VGLKACVDPFNSPLKGMSGARAPVPLSITAPADAGETQSAGKLAASPCHAPAYSLRIGRDPLRGLRPPNRLRGSAPSPIQSRKRGRLCPSEASGRAQGGRLRP